MLKISFLWVFYFFAELAGAVILAGLLAFYFFINALHHFNVKR
jgi:hypothetical protein